MRKMGRGKGLLFLVFLLCFLLAPAGRELKAELLVKVGCVDLQEIFQNYKKTRDLEEKLQVESEKRQKDLKKRREEVERLKEELEKEGWLLTELAKKEKEKEIEAKLKELEGLRQSFTEEIQEWQELYTKEIVDDIIATIKDIAEKEGYRFIFDVANLLYFPEEPEFDLTEKVLSELNEKYEAKE